MLGVIQGVKLAPEMVRGNWRLECVWGLAPRMDGRPELKMGRELFPRVTMGIST